MALPEERNLHPLPGNSRKTTVLVAFFDSCSNNLVPHYDLYSTNHAKQLYTIPYKTTK